EEEDGRAVSYRVCAGADPMAGGASRRGARRPGSEQRQRLLTKGMGLAIEIIPIRIIAKTKRQARNQRTPSSEPVVVHTVLRWTRQRSTLRGTRWRGRLKTQALQNTTSTFSIWRVLILGEGVLKVFFDVFWAGF